MNRRRTVPRVATEEPLREPFAPGSHPHAYPGSTLVEILVALAIAGLALTVFLAALEAGIRGVASVQHRTVAATLARSQMELIKTAPWPGPYPPVSAPPGYAVTVDTQPGIVAGVQLVTVNVQRDGRGVLTLQGYKGQR